MSIAGLASGSDVPKATSRMPCPPCAKAAEAAKRQNANTRTKNDIFLILIPCPSRGVVFRPIAGRRGSPGGCARQPVENTIWGHPDRRRPLPDKPMKTAGGLDPSRVFQAIFEGPVSWLALFLLHPFPEVDSSGTVASSGSQWRVRAGISPASRASSKRRVTPSRKDDSMMKSECQGVSRPPQKRGGVHRGRARRPMRCFYILLGIMNAVSNYHALEGWQWPRGSLT